MLEPLGASGGVGGVKGVLGAGRECRYSGVRRGIGAKRGHWGLIVVLGAIEGIRGSQGCRGVRRCRGVRDALGWQVDREPNHIGPSPGSQHSHWFPLGSDLPGQGQASDRNELCRLLYTVKTIFHDSLHISIYATSSHVLTCNIKKCYTDYFLCNLGISLHHQSDVL